uniref:Uncharacterized protein n=1 Tax=Arundo donax TaxID=35708 RepID=A0A0A9CIQ1_ARUDO
MVPRFKGTEELSKFSPLQLALLRCSSFGNCCTCTDPILGCTLESVVVGSGSSAPRISKQDLYH